MEWADLPHLALVRVYSHLDAHGRLAWRGVCPQWDVVERAPASWRYVEVCVSRADRRTEIVQLLVRHCKHIGHVNLVWTPSPECDFSCLYLKAFLSNKIRLRALTLTAAVHGHRFPAERAKMLFLLAKLLRRQEWLESFSLAGAWIRGNELCHQVKNAGGRVRRLALTGASRSPGPNLGRLLPRLSNLTELSLDADAVTPAFLEGLAGSVPGLESLTITARVHPLVPMSNAKWAALARTHPALGVHLEIYSLAYQGELKESLQPDLPLDSFYWHCERVDPAASRSTATAVADTLSLLHQFYWHRLKVVMVQLKNSGETVDEVLIELVSRCQQLSVLSFAGILRRLPTLAEMLHHAQRFSVLDVEPKHLTNEKRRYLEDMVKRYRSSGPIEIRLRDPRTALS